MLTANLLLVFPSEPSLAGNLNPRWENSQRNKGKELPPPPPPCLHKCRPTLLDLMGHPPKAQLSQSPLSLIQPRLGTMARCVWVGETLRLIRTGFLRTPPAHFQDSTHRRATLELLVSTHWHLLSHSNSLGDYPEAVEAHTRRPFQREMKGDRRTMANMTSRR